jgi:indolepyruvate ferredoxin oxidoreductase
MPANMVMLGAAFQHGCLPVSADAIEQAIQLNGVAVDGNVAAFRWGRAAIADPAAVERHTATGSSDEPVEPGEAARRIAAETGARGEFLRLLEIRVQDLVDYQDARYARDFAAKVAEVAALEADRGASGATPVVEAYARGLYKLLAYKDEYEVARLHLDAVERARLHGEFGKRAKVAVMLHPPALRALGMQRKIKLKRTAVPLFRILRRGRRLRGTKLDPFGRAHVRAVERALPGEYAALVREALERLTPETQGDVAAIAALADMVRGYEEIKLASVERFRLEARERLASLCSAA